MDVQRAEGRVWIPEARGFGPGEYASSVHGSQARILQTLGDPLSYDDLVCTSGFAFRSQVHDDMCPSAGHPMCGFVCLDNGLRALPWKVRSFEAFPSGKPREDVAVLQAEACAAIRESIDRGVPVQYGSEEDGLIVGYADEGRRWWCLHPYYQEGREPFWHDQAEGFAGGAWPWGISVWTEPKPGVERVPDPDLVTAALEQAVEMWKAEKREAYFVGEAAYTHWLQWLRDVEAGKVDDPRGGMQGNGWCFDVLIHSRRIAGHWLREKAGLFAGKTAKQLRAAADHYAQLVDSCTKDLDSPWDLTLGPGLFDRWTPSLRQGQIARLEAAREHDRSAVAAMEKALAAVR